MSCPSPGNCTLGGEYISARDGIQVFVADQRHGTWGRARALPRLAARNTGQLAFLRGLVCFSAGTCTAARDYAIRHKKYTATAVFVTAEKTGTWGRPERVPGSLVNLGTTVQLAGLSCGAPGNCSIGGLYPPISITSPSSTPRKTAPGPKPSQSAASTRNRLRPPRRAQPRHRPATRTQENQSSPGQPATRSFSRTTKPG